MHALGPEAHLHEVVSLIPCSPGASMSSALHTDHADEIWMADGLFLAVAGKLLARVCRSRVPKATNPKTLPGPPFDHLYIYRLKPCAEHLGCRGG